MSKHEHFSFQKRFTTRLLALLIVFFCASCMIFVTPSPSYAAGEKVCECTNTYTDGSVRTERGTSVLIFGDINGCYCGGVTNIAKSFINILTAGVTVIGTIGIIWSGFLYMTARDNEGQMATAKRRILQTVIGLVAFGLFDVVMNLMLPGGGASTMPTVASSKSKLVDGDDLVIHVEKPASSGTSSQPSTRPSSQSSSGQSSQSSLKPPSGSDCGSYGVGKGTVYYRQCGASYSNTQWKGGEKHNAQICTSACPMIAILNATIRVTNCKLTPEMFRNHMKAYTNNFTDRKGLFASDGNWSNKGTQIMQHYASYYKVNFKSINKSRVKAALQAGHAVIALGRRGDDDSNKIFSKNGHYVAFVDISGNTVYVKNAAAKGLDKVSFDFATKHAVSYWEVSK